MSERVERACKDIEMSIIETWEYIANPPKTIKEKTVRSVKNYVRRQREKEKERARG